MTRCADLWTEYSYQTYVASVVVTSLCTAQYIIGGGQAHAVKKVEDVKVLRKAKNLKNSLLVNESLTSEMNFSLKQINYFKLPFPSLLQTKALLVTTPRLLVT